MQAFFHRNRFLTFRRDTSRLRKGRQGFSGGNDDATFRSMRFFLAELRARARHVVGPILGILVMAYFGYHLVHGERGLLAWWQLKQDVKTASRQRAEVAEGRRILEHRVRLLNPGTLDPDMLEERARLMLGFGRSDDMIILTSEFEG